MGLCVFRRSHWKNFTFIRDYKELTVFFFRVVYFPKHQTRKRSQF